MTHIQSLLFEAAQKNDPGPTVVKPPPLTTRGPDLSYQVHEQDQGHQAVDADGGLVEAAQAGLALLLARHGGRDGFGGARLVRAAIGKHHSSLS